MSTGKDDMNYLDGHDFEVLVEQLVKKMGFIVEERKLTADGGIDILAKTYEPLLEGTYIIQCKRQAQKVGESIIRDLYGVVHARNANKGILITNSTFTKAAIEFARNKQLELIDGDKLRSLLLRHGIVQLDARTIVLPSYAIFLSGSFVPALRRMEDKVEDIKIGRVYVEKTIYNLKQWLNLTQTRLVRIDGYANFLTAVINQSLGLEVSKKEPDLQQIKNDCRKILEATDKFVDDYKSLFSVIPPQGFWGAHERLLKIYYAFFQSLSRFADDIERATKDPKPQRYNILLMLGDAEIKEFNEAVNFAVQKEQEERTRKRGCVIATAVMGSHLAQEVWVLRAFRDEFMMKNTFGRCLVTVYYALSPPIAALVSKNEILKIVLKRLVILPLVNKLSRIVYM